MIFESGLEIAGRPLEFSHHFADVARQLRQLLGAKENQGHDEDDDHVRNAKHFLLAAEPSGAVLA